MNINDLNSVTHGVRYLNPYYCESDPIYSRLCAKFGQPAHTMDNQRSRLVWTCSEEYRVIYYVQLHPDLSIKQNWHFPWRRQCHVGHDHIGLNRRQWVPNEDVIMVRHFAAHVKNNEVEQRHDSNWYETIRKNIEISDIGSRDTNLLSKIKSSKGFTLHMPYLTDRELMGLISMGYKISYRDKKDIIEPTENIPDSFKVFYEK